MVLPGETAVGENVSLHACHSKNMSLFWRVVPSWRTFYDVNMPYWGIWKKAVIMKKNNYIKKKFGQSQSTRLFNGWRWALKKSNQKNFIRIDIKECATLSFAEPFLKAGLKLIGQEYYYCILFTGGGNNSLSPWFWVHLRWSYMVVMMFFMFYWFFLLFFGSLHNWCLLISFYKVSLFSSYMVLL